MVEATTRALPRIRRTIAERMQASTRDSAQLTSVVAADMSEIMAMRRRCGERFRLAHGAGLSPLAVTAAVACRALAANPVLNASIDLDDGTATYYTGVNLGIAVDTPRGLLVPNIKDAHLLTIPELSVAIADLANRARSGKLTMSDLEAGTFTITNTGSRGSLLDTPLLRLPEVGILAVTKIERRPAVIGTGEHEHIEARDMSYLCLTYDHRLVDGADAARFLGDVKNGLERSVTSAELGLGDG